MPDYVPVHVDQCVASILRQITPGAEQVFTIPVGYHDAKLVCKALRRGGHYAIVMKVRYMYAEYPNTINETDSDILIMPFKPSLIRRMKMSLMYPHHVHPSHHTYDSILFDHMSRTRTRVPDPTITRELE